MFTLVPYCTKKSDAALPIRQLHSASTLSKYDSIHHQSTSSRTVWTRHGKIWASIAEKLSRSSTTSTSTSNQLGNLNSGRSPGERSSLEAAVPTSPIFNYHIAQTTLLFQISNTKKEDVD